jgi:hypothetical protein
MDEMSGWMDDETDLEEASFNIPLIYMIWHFTIVRDGSSKCGCPHGTYGLHQFNLLFVNLAHQSILSEGHSSTHPPHPNRIFLSPLAWALPIAKCQKPTHMGHLLGPQKLWFVANDIVPPFCFVMRALCVVGCP